MTLHVALAVSALAGSLVLFFAASRALGAIALVASGLEVAMAFGVIRLHLSGVPLGLVLGLALALPGAVAWFRAGSKAAVSGSAIVTFVGALQAASSWHGRL
jgi:hypothetical protein